MAEEPLPWLPVDSRILPIDFGLTPPREGWVRLGLFLQITAATLAVILSIGLIFVPRRTPVLAVDRSCQSDADCVLVVAPGQCCTCPEAVSSRVLGQNTGLAQYYFDLPQPSAKPPACGTCAACELVNQAVCLAGTCEAVFGP